jgi:hypothetical protein
LRRRKAAEKEEEEAEGTSMRKRDTPRGLKVAVPEQQTPISDFL